MNTHIHIPYQDSAAGISKRAGYIAFLEAFFIFTSLEALPIFLNERNVFVRSVIHSLMQRTLHCTSAEATLLHAHTCSQYLVATSNCALPSTCVQCSGTILQALAATTVTAAAVTVTLLILLLLLLL
jgi:hypothetical protein